MRRILLFSSGSMCRSILFAALLSSELDLSAETQLCVSGMYYDAVDVKNTYSFLEEINAHTKELTCRLYDEICDEVFDMSFIIVNFLKETTHEYIPKNNSYYVGYQGSHSDLREMYAYIKQHLVAPVKHMILTRREDNHSLNKKHLTPGDFQ